MMQANFAPTFTSLSLESQLDLVRNADLYEKRIKTIKDAELQAKAEVERLTKAKDLDTALKQAKQAEDDAKEALSLAKSEANSLVNNATAQATTLVKDAQVKSRQIVDSANTSVREVLDKLSEKQKELESLTNTTNSLAQQIAGLKEEYNILYAQVQAKEADKQQLLSVIADKQRKLKALMVE